jgi:hypothetical protein
MFRARSTSTRTLGWILVLTLTAPSVLAQAPAPKPSTPAKAPAAAPSAPAAAPSSPPATSAAPPATTPPAATTPQEPFKKSLAETLTGVAKSEYEAGRLLYADGDYAGASLKFQRAYEESKDPRLLWNTAAAEKNLRHYAKVVELVERYVAEGGSRLKPEDIAEADALLATVRAFISTVTLDVQPEGADIFVDDVKVGVSPLPKPVLIDMGEHRIRVSKEGFQDFNATQSLQGGAPFSLMVALQAVVHQGRFRIVASPGETILVDGKQVGSGEWEGVLPSGIHSVTVQAAGKRTYQSDVAVQDNQTASVRVSLESATPAAAKDDKGSMTWLWIAGGAVLATGLGVGAYFVFKPEDEEPVPGSLGTVELPLGARF